jgi:hypothetical protein
MKKINILSNDKEEFVFKQYSPNEFSSEFHFFYNSKDDIVWDLIVLYEEIDEKFTLRCKKGGRLFISGEPPICKCYPKYFLDQFDIIISAHPQLKHPNNHMIQQSLLWYFGYEFKNQKVRYNFEDIKTLQVNKTKAISFITSSRNFLPGHVNRLSILKELQHRYGNKIDVFGSGISYVVDKAEAILPYRFTICVENCSIPNYWSEKIADIFLGYSIPIYHGCTNIEDYFPSQSYIKLDISNLNNTFSIIDDILNNEEEIYKLKYPFLIEARRKLLYEYNIFPSIIKYYNTLANKNDEIEKIELFPSKKFRNSWKDSFFLKLDRFLKKRL